MNRRDDYDTDNSRAGDDPPGRGQPTIDDVAEPDEQVLEIRGTIEQTRAQMTETIDELQERLSPAYLKEQVREQVVEQYKHAKDTIREATIGKVEDMVERVSDTMYQARRGVADTISANPIPSALVGIGLAWLWMNRRSDSQLISSRRGSGYRSASNDDQLGGYAGGRSSSVGRGGGGERWDRSDESVANFASKAGEAVSGAAGQVRDAASNLASKAQERVSGVVDQAQQTAGQFVDVAQYQARRVEERFNSAMRESPLAVGAVALALGTAVGLAVPQTRKENEWMGETRDNLMDNAQSVARDAMEQVKQAADNAGDQGGVGRSPGAQA